MKATELPDNILQRMGANQRQELGVQTSEEAMATFVARSEKQLQDKMAQYLGLKAITFMRQRMDKRATGTLGWPDFTFSINSRPIAIEVKFGNHTLDPDQRTCIKGMMLDGWHVFLVRDVPHFIRVCQSYAHGMSVFGRTNITDEELATA